MNVWSVKIRRCFIEDGGRPSGAGLQGRAPNRHKLLGVSEPLTTCRNVCNRRRNRDLDFYPASKGWERPAYCPTGVRHEGGVTLGRASVRNTGTCRSDVKGEIQAVHHRKDGSTDAEHRDGEARSRDEGPVMGLDRRGIVIRFYPVDNPRGDDLSRGDDLYG